MKGKAEFHSAATKFALWRATETPSSIISECWVSHYHLRRKVSLMLTGRKSLSVSSSPLIELCLSILFKASDDIYLN